MTYPHKLKPETEKVVDKMERLVNTYHTMKELDGHTLSIILKDFVSALFYLETVRAEVHYIYHKRLVELTDEQGLAYNRAQSQTAIDVPDMYRLRRLMDAGYEVVGAIRTNISLLKQEMQQV